MVHLTGCSFFDGSVSSSFVENNGFAATFPYLAPFKHPVTFSFQVDFKEGAANLPNFFQIFYDAAMT